MKTEILERYKTDLEAKLKVVEASSSTRAVFTVTINKVPMPAQYFEAAKACVANELRRELADVENELKALVDLKPSSSA